MSFIIKETSALLNTRVTDVGRKMLSTGNFSIYYYKLGDSEVNYDDDNPRTNEILEPSFDINPISLIPDIKHELVINDAAKDNFGVGYVDSVISSVYNQAPVRGFFTGSSETGWYVDTTYGHLVNPNYYINISEISGNTITLHERICALITPPPEDDCCEPPPIPPQPTPTPTPTSGACDGTPPEPYCPTSGSTVEGEANVGDIVVIVFNCCDNDCGRLRDGNLILTYKICCLNNSRTVLELDRNLPDLINLGFSGEAKVFIYPSEIYGFYGTYIPAPMEVEDIINYETPCDISRGNPKIWNMNIPWSENPAGLSGSSIGFEKYKSNIFLGTKEYLGYASNSGQTFYDTTSVLKETDTFYLNSFLERIDVQPDQQKAIAIIHYTNNSADMVYGEKLAMNSDILNIENQTMGNERTFKVSMPSLLWHKNKKKTIGETFYVNPPGFNLFKVNYMRSDVNMGMNSPGLRYFHLWDSNVNKNNELNRIGKVFPDLKTIVIDDEEIIAALSYKSNRNWTLPAPSLKLISPDSCQESGNDGIIKSGQTIWATYRFSNSTAFTNSLHCNYYSSISFNDSCVNTDYNVAVSFGEEFPFLNQKNGECTAGFFAENFSLIVQLTDTGKRPLPDKWVEIDKTNDLAQMAINGYLTENGMAGVSFIIDGPTYFNKVGNNDFYALDYLEIPNSGETESKCLNFGDETFFYGNINANIEATIYEMNYKINLSPNTFNASSNPTWKAGKKTFISEIGLYDKNKNLIIMSKLQSPQIRSGNQHFNIKLDF